jgi:glycosyltransferase involved in cell wall biosynthesis
MTETNITLEEKELSIVIPCLNEEKSLPFCLQRAKDFIRNHNISGEVIVSDNGSTDSSKEIARSNDVILVDAIDRGYGSAIMVGIKKAKGKFIIFADADDSYHFDEIMPLLNDLRQGSDLVVGNRFQGGIEKGAMPWLHRYIGTPIQSAIGNIMFGISLGDFNCGMRGVTKQCYEDLDMHTTGMEFISEMIVKAALRKKKITEKPVRLYCDKRNRPSHLHTFRDGWRNLRFFLLYSPAWLFLYPGILLMLAGFIISVLLYLGPIKLGNTRFDIHTLTYTSASIILGFQLVNVYVFTRLYAAIHGLHPFQHQFMSRFNRWFSLEKGIMLGLLFLLTGISLNIRAILYWKNMHFGDLDPIIVLRWVIPSATLVLLGAQVMISCFFLSVLSIRNKSTADVETGQ